MKKETQITSIGIKRALAKVKVEEAICEYLWNGFDAGATTLQIQYSVNEFGKVEHFSIKDNGSGINLDDLDNTFGKFNDSEKPLVTDNPKHSSKLRGQNGVGRLTFFHFADSATWETAYRNNGIRFGKIYVRNDDLKHYEPTKNDEASLSTFTNVHFMNVHFDANYFEQVILQHLKITFCWFLELNQLNDFKITINGNSLDYSNLILEAVSQRLQYSPYQFEIRFIQWNEGLKGELSKVYYINQGGQEIYKEFTTLNRKGDHFFHSIFVTSSLFDTFSFRDSSPKEQSKMFYFTRNSEEFKFVESEITILLRSKRKPYLRTVGAKMIEEFDQRGIIPTSKNPWEQQRITLLKNTLQGLYEAQPKLFITLNYEQQFTFVRLINLLLDTNEQENILKILEEIVDLEPSERETLASVLKITRLDNIISTIKFIEDRYRTYSGLKELVFNKSLKANEVNHLQTLIENNYWIFGEEYHLATSAEPKFEEALRQFVHKISGRIFNRKIDHPDKEKEMDIFAIRQNKHSSQIENLVVELKHPNITLGTKEVEQIKKYVRVIKNQDEFNDLAMKWEFILVGNKFDNTEEIEALIESSKPHGEKHLIQSNDNGRIKIYVKTWSTIFAEFEIRHEFLQSRLRIERDKLISENKTADQIVKNSIENTAISPKPTVLPKKARR